MEDIGYLLFKEVLGMADYPAGPFSGVILKDLVMFFLIPSIFIILVIYMMLGRLFYPATQRGLRLLVGIGAYLFIVFGGYFGVFAELAGPYFIILIFIMGLLYMFLELFRVKPVPAAGGHGLAAGGFGSGTSYTGVYSHLNKTELEALLRQAQRALEDPNTKDKGMVLQQYIDLLAAAKGRGVQVNRSFDRFLEKFKMAKTT